MAFPLSSVFEGLKGLVNVTITADANGTPELVHFADEAGQACAHFAIHEWDALTEHITSMLHKELGGLMTPTIPAQAPAETSAAAVPAGVSATAPFLAPADAGDTEPAPDDSASSAPAAGESA